LFSHQDQKKPNRLTEFAPGGVLFAMRRFLLGCVVLAAIAGACSVVNAPADPSRGDGDEGGGGSPPATSGSAGDGGSGGSPATGTGGDAGSGGMECPGTEVACGSMCFDTTSDPTHCGNCVTMCDTATEICATSMCTTCPGAQVPCDNVCVDTMNDEQNCGMCGMPCPMSQTCGGGQCSNCGDLVLQPNEESDPPPGPSSNVPIDPGTCRYDFSAITQLYCSGSCGSWDPMPDCGQGDADAFCKLKMDNPLSTATSFLVAATAAAPGICCPPPTIPPGGLGCTNLGVLSSRGVMTNVGIDETNMAASHNGGTVVTNVVCTDP
jgi:stigma-specific protein Stig1